VDICRLAIGALWDYPAAEEEEMIWYAFHEADASENEELL